MRRKSKQSKSKSGRPGRVIGKFPSIKMGRSIPFRSSLELDVLYLLELDPSVVSYTYDTPTVLCVLPGAYLPFRCDFEVVTGTTKEQLLIQRASHSSRLYDELRNAYAERTLRFSVITEAEVRTGPRLSNSKLIYKYARQSVSTDENIVLSRFFTNRSKGSIGELQAFLHNNGANRMTAYTFLYLNYIQFTATENLEENTPIWLSA